MPACKQEVVGSQQQGKDVGNNQYDNECGDVHLLSAGLGVTINYSSMRKFDEIICSGGRGLGEK